MVEGFFSLELANFFGYIILIKTTKIGLIQL